MYTELNQSDEHKYTEKEKC